MSTVFAITTLIELAVSILLVYGFMHEDKMIDFEQAVKRIVVGHYRRWKRLRGITKWKKPESISIFVNIAKSKRLQKRFVLIAERNWN